MSFNNRADLILREHFESMDDFVKRAAPTPSDINKSHGVNRVDFPEEYIWNPRKLNVHDTHISTPPPWPTPSGSASVGETHQRLKIASKCPHIDISVVDGSSKKVVNEPLTLKDLDLNRVPASPPENAVSTCQVPMMSKENKSESAPVANTIYVPQTEQSKIVKDLVKDEAHEHLSHEEGNVKMAMERTQALKLEAKKNKELKELLVDGLEQDLGTMRHEIMLAKKLSEQDTCIVKCDPTNKTSVGVDSSVSSHESADGFTESEMTEKFRAFFSAASSPLPSEDTEGSKLYLRIHSSKDSISESDTSEESEDSESESVTSEDSEDSESEESEDSADESEASEESDDSGHDKPSDLEVSAAVKSQNVTALSLADPSEADSSQNTITETEYHEHPNETNIVVEATNATDEAKSNSDDDWDFCGF